MGWDIADDFFESLSDFLGQNVRVITIGAHYRGECKNLDKNNLNILLRNVVEKKEDGWIPVSNLMMVKSEFIQSIYLEKNYPFGDEEALILSIKEGKILPENEQDEA